ncbi:MAG: sugar phosphate isomerase/epimerase [Saprospiraceae bacterium]|nr:sugar phosphate isomerase/epimerase [Saprospiraceae bacterium]
MNRRHFLEVGSAILATSLFPDPLSLGDQMKKSTKGIGLQLYTVRDEMEKDVKGTLKKIADIGYTFIENAGYNNGKFYGMPKEEFKTIINDLNLKMVSGHTGLGTKKGEKGLTYQFEDVCKDAKYVGQKYLGTGSLALNKRKTIDDYKKFADNLNNGGEIAKQYGLKIFHHNHDFEFVKINGVVPYEILLKETDKNLVTFELDHYWTKIAGVDSLKLMKDYPGRFSLWHIKDMDNTEKQAFTEVGTGIINYSKIFDLKSISQMEYFFIEQDSCVNHPPLKSIEISFNNLKKLKL